MTKSALVILLMIGSPLPAQSLQDHFQGFEGTIVVYDEKADQYVVHDERRAETRYTPFSTFKIANSLIALETDVVSDVDQILHWDREKYPAEPWWPEAWREEQDLRGAFRYSVVPLYRGIASEVGAARMQAHLDALDYGNRDISSGIDDFWLNASLKISAFEQVAFLRRLHHEELTLSQKTLEAVKGIMVEDEIAGGVLRSKTGAGTLDNGRGLGWYVGYFEKEGTAVFFALNIEGESFEAIVEPRVAIAKAILRELGVFSR